MAQLRSVKSLWITMKVNLLAFTILVATTQAVTLSDMVETNLTSELSDESFETLGSAVAQAEEEPSTCTKQDLDASVYEKAWQDWNMMCVKNGCLLNQSGWGGAKLWRARSFSTRIKHHWKVPAWIYMIVSESSQIFVFFQNVCTKSANFRPQLQFGVQFPGTQIDLLSSQFCQHSNLYFFGI